VEIIPAIDLKDGRCVRLYQGDYEQETVFAEDPLAAALKWYSQGARWLHVVDLDGAATGEPKNLLAIEQIMQKSGLLVELGGGIRKEKTAEKLLGQGVSRVVLGTAAIENPGLVRRLCRRFDQAIAIGLDARDGRIAIRGWSRDTNVDALVLSREMVKAGAKRFICTDIKKDGTMTEPNFDMVGRLVAEIGMPVIASGGICRLEHLQRLRGLGVEGVIIGRALYTGDIDLRQAITRFGG
jgi:phosphoribosylformimino-5-aminoimidazole carboxamide ribotide isomerase